MVFMIIILFLHGYFIGNIAYFQTNPYWNHKGFFWGIEFHVGLPACQKSTVPRNTIGGMVTIFTMSSHGWENHRSEWGIVLLQAMMEVIRGYHLVMTNIAMEIHHVYPFLIGKPL